MDGASIPVDQLFGVPKRRETPITRAIALCKQLDERLSEDAYDATLQRITDRFPDCDGDFSGGFQLTLDHISEGFVEDADPCDYVASRRGCDPNAYTSDWLEMQIDREQIAFAREFLHAVEGIIAEAGWPDSAP